MLEKRTVFMLDAIEKMRKKMNHYVSHRPLEEFLDIYTKAESLNNSNMVEFGGEIARFLVLDRSSGHWKFSSVKKSKILPL